MNGEIKVHSIEDRGSTFIFYFLLQDNFRDRLLGSCTDEYDCPELPLDNDCIA